MNKWSNDLDSLFRDQNNGCVFIIDLQDGMLGIDHKCRDTGCTLSVSMGFLVGGKEIVNEHDTYGKEDIIAWRKL